MRPPAPRLLLVTLLALVPPGLAAVVPATHAQGTWLDRDHPRTVQLEIARVFIGDFREDWTTTTWYLSTRQALGTTHWSFVGELPFAFAGYRTSGLYLGGLPYSRDVNSSVIGNPYFGVELKPEATGPWLEFGGRPSVGGDSEEFAGLTGILSDNERWEAFYDKTSTLRLGLHNRVPIARGEGYVDVHVAPALWITELSSDDVELFVTYGLHLRSQGRSARVGGGLTGRLLATTSDADFNERTWHQFDFAADFLTGRLRPGLSLHVPLDSDLTDVVDATLGLTLDLVLE